MTTERLNYVMDDTRYKLLKMIRGERVEWWKSIPLGSDIGSTFHFGNVGSWSDHFDIYANNKKIGMSATKIDATDMIAICSGTNKFYKNPEAEIFISPDHDQILDGISLQMKTFDNGSIFEIQSNAPTFLLYASTSGRLIRKIPY